MWYADTYITCGHLINACFLKLSFLQGIGFLVSVVISTTIAIIARSTRILSNGWWAAPGTASTQATCSLPWEIRSTTALGTLAVTLLTCTHNSMTRMGCRHRFLMNSNSSSYTISARCNSNSNSNSCNSTNNKNSIKQNRKHVVKKSQQI